MLEVKADALEQSFEAFEDEGVAALKEELEQLKSKIAAGVIAAQRPVLDGVKSASSVSFIDGYLRRGIESALEMKALGGSTDAIGGYAVPEEIDAVIDRTLTAISPIRAIANVVKVGSAGYRKLVTSGGTPSGWVGFEAARPETNTPGFTEIVPASGELYANPAASQQMLDDAMFDVEAWLANEIATEFARAEGMAFVKGNGTNQPLGFLSSPNATTADGVRPMGTLQTIGTGAAGAFPGTNPADKLVDLVQSLRAPYRQGAVFVMNSSTLASIRKFKTADGAFLFQPSLAVGIPATLLGYPVVEAEDMPDVAAGSLSVAFGNFKAGYVIAERNATTILRDPFTHKPYVHFYATQLAEYGNRIPFLTFEILGDEGSASVGSIVEDASNGIIASEASNAVHGYAAYGASQRSALQPLIDHFALPLFDDGEKVRASAAFVGEVEDFELGCDADGADAPRGERSQMAASALPRSLALTYYDPARDFQTGQMRASAAVSSGIDEVEELPAAIGADQAKALVEGHIARRWAGRDKLVLRLPPARLGLEPGAIVSVGGALWRAEQVTLEEMVVRLELSPVSESIESAPADPGTHLPAPDVVATPTVLTLLDLPDLGIGRHDVPVLQVAAFQPVAGWRPMPIEITFGGEVRTIASAAGEAVIGTAVNVLVDGPTTGFDEVGFLDVELADGEHWLESRDDAALGNGANLAAIGSEVIQFGRAIPTGERQFRLERLLRGSFGTEWAMASHGSNETLVLIRPGTLQEIALPPSAIGASISIRPRGLADDDSQPIEGVVTGEAMRPPSPVDLRAEIQGDGALSLAWTRRSRLGWAWPSADPPLGESTERYRVTVEGSASTLTLAASEPRALVSAESLNGLSGSVTITVVQIGDFAESRPVTATITL